jgi:ABC-2 type transport system permease protein
MITDIWTVMRKEFTEFLLQGANGGSGRFSNWISILIILGVFGVFLPLQAGTDWLQKPLFLVFWGAVPLFLVASVTADTFAGERERHTLETLLASRLSDRAILFGKVAAAVAYGWGLSLATAVISALVVNLVYSGGHLMFYPLPMAALGVIWGLLASGLSATAGVLISLRASSARQAAQIMSVAIMVLLFVPLLVLPALPAQTRAQLGALLNNASFTQVALGFMVVLAIVDGLLLLAGMARFQRSKLILD